MQLKNKVVIVTGGASGIGKAIVELFAKQGAIMVIADLNEKEGYALASKIPKSVFIKTDVRTEIETNALIDIAAKKFGRIDIAVNNAGIYLSSEENVSTLPFSVFLKIMETNFNGAFFVTKFSIPYIQKTKGVIINIASMLGLVPDAETPIYCSSKAALVMFTKSTALRYAREGVRINCICPGPIDTPLLRKAFSNEREFSDYFSETNPMGRAGHPEEVANLALFLASDKNSYITGGIYTIDGGATLH